MWHMPDRCLSDSPSPRVRFAAVAISLAAALIPAAATGAGFGLDYESARAVGTATAGSASSRDASTIFYNVAGLGFLDGNEIIAGGQLFLLHDRFEDGGSTILGGGQAMPGTNGRDAIPPAFVPWLYATRRLSPEWTIGIGLSLALRASHRLWAVLGRPLPKRGDQPDDCQPQSIRRLPAIGLALTRGGGRCPICRRAADAGGRFRLCLRRHARPAVLCPCSRPCARRERRPGRQPGQRLWLRLQSRNSSGLGPGHPYRPRLSQRDRPAYQRRPAELCRPTSGPDVPCGGRNAARLYRQLHQHHAPAAGPTDVWG